jgi:hypothetical protein
MVGPSAIGKACAKPSALPLPPDVKAEGLGDGRTHQEGRHRQAALDDATQACYPGLNQTAVWLGSRTGLPGSRPLEDRQRSPSKKVDDLDDLRVFSSKTKVPAGRQSAK